jgi:uncharacterized protein
MSSLSFPDINVWLAIATPEHVHSPVARGWRNKETEAIAFYRLSKLGFLRLMTTADVMDGKPLTMSEAWRVYDHLYEDDRVTFISERPDVDKRFREKRRDELRRPRCWPMPGSSLLPKLRRAFW